MKKTLYDYLGLDDKASIEEIEAMYRAQKARLADATDNEAQNELKFVQQAFSVLADQKQRARYDQSLASMKSADDAVIYYSKDESSSSHPFRTLALLAVIAFAGYEGYQHFYSGHLDAAAKAQEESTAQDNTAGNPKPSVAAAETSPPANMAPPAPDSAQPEPPVQQQAAAQQPAATDINNVDAVPIPVPATQKSAYISFLSTPSPRAFVICNDGHVMTFRGNRAFVDSRLATLPAGCAPYAVDDSVVWNR